ncbi:MAG: hypothetical protein ACOC4C_04310 [Fibrobacterota bacterium]
MRKKNIIYERKTVGLEEILRHEYIPFLHGRPSREQAIGSDDVVNLQIALNTAENLLEFIEQV